MTDPKENEDQPINLEETSSTELNRGVVSDDDGSSSTIAPVWEPKPHARTDRRELLGQPFENDPSSDAEPASKSPSRSA